MQDDLARAKSIDGWARDRIGALRWVRTSFFAVGTKASFRQYREEGD